MHREIPVPIAVGIILAVLVVVGFLLFRAWTGQRSLPPEAIKIPPEAAREFQKGQGARQLPSGGFYIPPPSPSR